MVSRRGTDPRYREGISLMTDTFRSEDQRPGSFKKGHKKRGGRQRGTPNKFTAEYKRDILEAAHRIGEDANGTLGVVGYLSWVAGRYPRIFCGLHGSMLELQELEIGLPQREPPTVEEFDEAVRGAYWARRPRPHSDGTEPRPRQPTVLDARTGRAGKRNPLGPPQRESASRGRRGRKGRTNTLTPIYPGRGPAWTPRPDQLVTSYHLRTRRSSADWFRPPCRAQQRRAWEHTQRARRRRRREEHESRAIS